MQSHLSKTILCTEIPELGFLMHKHMLMLPKICLSTKKRHYISKFWHHKHMLMHQTTYFSHFGA